MPRNAFLDESRDARMKLGLDGVLDQLRVPETLRRLIMEHKPATMSVGDFASKAMVDEIIDAYQSHGQYREIIGLLVSVFGAPGDGSAAEVTNVTNGDRRPLAKAAAR